MRDSVRPMSISENTIDWSRAVERIKARHADAIVPEVENFLKRARSRRVLVACSGGADSVFLLVLLYAFREELRIDLMVAHYNHRWRGAESDIDAVFVESLANALGVPFASAARAENAAAFTETTARALRLDFLREVALKNDCFCVAFGHQMDDILETQLQRISRGSGSDGLAAPRPIARFENFPTHIRPLLNMRSMDVRFALNSSQIPWREDASNEDLSIARNALRRKIIPAMYAALDRDPTIGAARSRRLVEEDAAALNRLAKETFPAAYAGDQKLSRKDLRAASRALTRRALMAWLDKQDCLASVGASAMDLLLNEIYGSKKQHQISAGSAYIVIEEDLVHLRVESEEGPELPEEAVSLEAGTSLLLPTGASLAVSFVELDPQLRERILAGEVDPAEEAYFLAVQTDGLAVRGWQPGDRFAPIGAPGTKKLQDWFIDRHIAQAERKRLPVVINDAGEIIWVPGFPPADSLKIRRNTNRALRLTYRGINPPSTA